MTPDQAKASYRRQLSRHGEQVEFRRRNPDGGAELSATVWARITGYDPVEIVGGIAQGTRKVVALAEDFDGTDLAGGPKEGDIIRRGTARMRVSGDVDGDTRRVSGVTIAWQMQAVGA